MSVSKDEEREAGEPHQSFHPRRGGKWAGRTARFGTVDGGLACDCPDLFFLGLSPHRPGPTLSRCSSPLPPAPRGEGLCGAFLAAWR